MKVKFKCQNGRLQYFFTPESTDVIDLGRVKMAKDSCEVRLQQDWNLDKIHTDILALTTLLIVYPYIGKRLLLPFGVTRKFHGYFKKMTNIDVLPVDDSLEVRKASTFSVPAVAFSGGVDSMAALALLQKTTNCFFIDRMLDITARTKYRKDSAYYACNQLRKKGFSIHMIESDFESVRQPLGVVLEESQTIPALLMADYIGIDSVAHGTTLLAGYKMYRPETDDLTSASEIELWIGMFEIVDVSLNLMTMGMTEQGTMKIVSESLYKDLAQSCVRGAVGKPCMNCIKCLRKTLLEMSINRQEISDALLTDFFGLRGLDQVLAKTRYEIDLAYIASLYGGENTLLRFIQAHTADVFDFSWYEKWHGPSSVFIPEKYRQYVLNRIYEHLQVMTPDDEINMKVLNMGAIKKLEWYSEYQKRLKQELIKAKKNNKKT